MCGDFSWRVSDFEELVGVTHRGWVCCALVCLYLNFLVA